MDDLSRLRRKDTTKGPPLRILSLDGGGVRGYSMLIILQELMHRTFVEIEGRAPTRHEIPKPCDHFDLIAGTGTGGLIAIMLGRLRLDLDTCKDVYVRMTRRVFETDKTFAGIPYKSTMFKASKLEEVIRECVREHTVFEDEGNDALANAVPMTADVGMTTDSSEAPQRTMSQSSRYSQMGQTPIAQRGPGFGSLRWGNANALLYDSRENRTKTAVAAVLKGTTQTVLLRSYDSRREPAPDVNCMIWQAGRATSAAAMAFKPIQIGQSIYLDEGAGKYNPAPQILDEAAVNEWPGREVGVFVSIGTGKRPSGTSHRQSEWWEGFLGGSTMGDFADARRRLISKLEGCEETHQYMLRERLAARQVNVENYFRLNVEVGVGEFGMNEWNRLSDISTNTRMYLAKREVEAMNQGAAAKMAKIHFTKIRHERAEARKQAGHVQRDTWDNPWDRPLPVAPLANPLAVELPGDEPQWQTESFRPGVYDHRPSVVDQKYVVNGDDELYSSSIPQTPHQGPAQPVQPYGSYQQTTPQPYQHRASAPGHLVSTPSIHSNGDPSPRLSFDNNADEHSNPPRNPPPPLPPKTPLPYPDQQRRHPSAPTTFTNMGELGRSLPYPDVLGPPPAVNTASKPTLSR